MRMTGRYRPGAAADCGAGSIISGAATFDPEHRQSTPDLAVGQQLKPAVGAHEPARLGQDSHIRAGPAR